MATALGQEYNFYISHHDEFVLINGEKVVAFFDSYEKPLCAPFSFKSI